MDALAQRRLQSEYHDRLPYFDFSTVWSCCWEEIAGYPITPLSNVSDDLWIIPAEWCPPDSRAPSKRTIDFRRAIGPGQPNSEACGLIRRLKRLAILDRFQTMRNAGRSMPPPTPITWVKKYQQCVRAARYSVEEFRPDSKPSRCPDGPTIFRSLSEEQFAKLKTSNPTWANSCIARFNALYAADLFDDWPAADVGRYEFAPRQNSKASESFSDEAFSEILAAALWLNRIQSDVLQAYLSTRDIVETNDGRRRHSLVQQYRRDCVGSWESDSLKSGSAFPYWIEMSGRGMKVQKYISWPLETVLSLKTLLVRCQAANGIIVLASTGMRVGEEAALGRHSLIRRGDRHFLAGSSFKDTDVVSGDHRKWPFPRIAVRAFDAQLELAAVFGRPGDFWVPFSGGKNISGLPDLSTSMQTFGRTIGMMDGRCLADIDGDVTAHRFRFSVARYVALSLTGASQILFDVLGHDDVEVTLGYAQQDPELQEDINRIRTEVKAIRAKEVFDGSNENGGPAAELVRRVKADLLVRSGKEELDTDDIGEAAAILGDAEITRPGVLCTAQPLERGDCASRLGIRDHGACTPKCMHRLEMAAYRQDHRDKLNFLLDKIPAAAVGLRVFYQNQIIANLEAHPSFFDDFKSDPRLAAALVGCTPKTFERLQPALRASLELLLRNLDGSHA